MAVSVIYWLLSTVVWFGGDLSAWCGLGMYYLLFTIYGAAPLYEAAILPFRRFETRYKGKTTKRNHIVLHTWRITRGKYGAKRACAFPSPPTRGESITPQRRTHSQRRRSLPPRRRCIVNPAKWALGHFINGREASIKTKQKNTQYKHWDF